MAQLKYPIGIQTFSTIIEEGYTYVDKTRFIELLSREGRYYFLSRPRRFGKSLLLSTLHAYFDGRRDLFKDLYLDTADVNWTPSPVLHFDFNTGLYFKEEGLEDRLNLSLGEYEEKYGLTPSKDNQNPAVRFERLIRTVHEKTGRKVVILVDEYDKPLLGIEDKPELFERNQALLKGFFGNLKSMDPYIRLAFLTGVARFNKVSIFSDLNNLQDISISDRYADICGWTEEELLNSFGPGINDLAKERHESFEETVNGLRDYYDGYKFSRNGNRLYNPFSVLIALQQQEIEPFWFETGTPTFLVKRVKKSGILLPELNNQYRSRDELASVGLLTGNPVALMFQTGYLTIDSYDIRRHRYRLRFPNREVEIGFAKGLYPLYVSDDPDSNSPFSLYKFQDDLFDGEPDQFMKRLRTLVKDDAYELQNEANYQNIVWLLCTLCSTYPQTESHSYKGRSDLEVKTPEYIYIFEFKYNGSAEDAMSQLRQRDYAGRYALDRRTVYLIAANFSTGKDHRGLTDWIISTLSR